MTPNLDFKGHNILNVKKLKMLQDRAIVTMADQYKVVYDLSIGTVFNDLERPINQISRSRQYTRC